MGPFCRCCLIIMYQFQDNSEPLLIARHHHLYNIVVFYLIHHVNIANHEHRGWEAGNAGGGNAQ